VKFSFRLQLSRSLSCRPGLEIYADERKWRHHPYTTWLPFTGSNFLVSVRRPCWFSSGDALLDNNCRPTQLMVDDWPPVM